MAFLPGGHVGALVHDGIEPSALLGHVTPHGCSSIVGSTPDHEDGARPGTKPGDANQPMVRATDGGLEHPPAESSKAARRSEATSVPQPPDRANAARAPERGVTRRHKARDIRPSAGWVQQVERHRAPARRTHPRGAHHGDLGTPARLPDRGGGGRRPPHRPHRRLRPGPPVASHRRGRRPARRQLRSAPARPPGRARGLRWGTAQPGDRDHRASGSRPAAASRLPTPPTPPKPPVPRRRSPRRTTRPTDQPSLFGQS